MSIEKQNNSTEKLVTSVALLKEWLSISESQICSTEVLADQLPRVNDLLETSMNDISSRFSKIASHSAKLRQNLNNIIKEIDNNNLGNTLHNLITEAENNELQQINNEIGKIVTGMQFQDRVSQNILITINIMKTIADYLDKEFENSVPNISKDERKKLINKDFAKELLEKFRLGELQHAFVDHLVSHGYIETAEEIGFTDIESAKKDDDIELF